MRVIVLLFTAFILLNATEFIKVKELKKLKNANVKVIVMSKKELNQIINQKPIKKVIRKKSKKIIKHNETNLEKAQDIINNILKGKRISNQQFATAKTKIVDLLKTNKQIDLFSIKNMDSDKDELRELLKVLKDIQND